jgi:hypothetical protein
MSGEFPDTKPGRRCEPSSEVEQSPNLSLQGIRDAPFTPQYELLSN